MDEQNTFQEVTNDDPLMTEPDHSSLPKIDIQFDWEQYFHDFCNAHGKWPVMYGDDLLFPDGWRYNAYDYAGPEHKPPTDPDEMKVMMTFYWERRRTIIRGELNNLEHFLNDVRAIQQTKSRPILQSVSYQDDDGKTVRRSQPVDFHTLNRRLDWLREDLQCCETELAKIK